MDLTVLRAVGALIERIEEITFEQRNANQDDLTTVHFFRHNDLVADVFDADLAAFLTQAPHLVTVMREALLLTIKLHRPHEGRCRECKMPAPCTTYRHLRREMQLERR